MKFGITEAGDAGLDLSWENKLSTVDGAILITKNITSKFMKAVLRNQEKLIIHVTCTGWGGTVMEPNVPLFIAQLRKARTVVEMGFPMEKIVIRVDPIIPIQDGIEKARKVIKAACEMGFKKFRVSVLDMYPHVRDRFREAGVELPYDSNFTASDKTFYQIDMMLAELIRDYPDISIMSCAEPKLRTPRKVGCVSGYDLDLLGIEADDDLPNYQRPNCLCIGNKTELLTNKTRCPHQCLYCYWKD